MEPCATVAACTDIFLHVNRRGTRVSRWGTWHQVRPAAASDNGQRRRRRQRPVQARLTTGRAASWVPRGGTSRHERCARGRRHGLMMPDRRQGERPAHGVAGSRQTAQRQTVPWCAALHVQVRAAPPPLAASQLAPRRGHRVRPASPQLHPRRPGHIPMDRHLARTASGMHASERSARHVIRLKMHGWLAGSGNNGRKQVVRGNVLAGAALVAGWTCSHGRAAWTWSHGRRRQLRKHPASTANSVASMFCRHACHWLPLRHCRHATLEAKVLLHCCPSPLTARCTRGTDLRARLARCRAALCEQGAMPIGQ